MNGKSPRCLCKFSCTLPVFDSTYASCTSRGHLFSTGTRNHLLSASTVRSMTMMTTVSQNKRQTQSPSVTRLSRAAALPCVTRTKTHTHILTDNGTPNLTLRKLSAEVFGICPKAADTTFFSKE